MRGLLIKVPFACYYSELFEPIILYSNRWRVVDYYLIRTHGNIRLMDQLDVIGRTSELARLFGIQFYEVLTRGSQFRVESIMLRLVKARNYIPISSSVQVWLIFSWLGFGLDPT